MYGLSDELIEKIKKIRKDYNVKMYIFGSRARGNYKYNSDIDIAIFDYEISVDEKYKIMNEFDKIDSQYKIDVVFTQNIKNKKFLNSIKKEGKEI